ncbi:pilus assembly protein [Myxococcaceae bacterium JPH2]|nr:pilus assembly protein [Myxococcaceae bacterium JPH2]
MPGHRILRLRRGQALVLFALTLLLMALMVLMTLGFGMRAKERVEIQMAADAAAYSEAVSVARTFNAIAVMNRAQVAHMVAMAGTQAMISKSGQVYAAHQVACPGDVLEAAWFAADKAAAAQTRALQGQAGSLYSASLTLYSKLLTEQLGAQKLAARIAREANAELQAPAEGAAKSLMEVNGDGPVPEESEVMQGQKTGTSPGGGCGAVSGAVCPAGGSTRPSLHATMGSLGWTWVHNRAGGSAGFGSGNAASSAAFRHYNSPAGMDPSRYGTVSGRNSWGHDHATVVIPTRCINPPKPPVVPVTGAWVMSDERQTREDQHVYGARAPPGQQPENAEEMGDRHTLGTCVVCPGIWPFAMGYNTTALGAGGGNQYGQPKLYSILFRDYASDSRRKHPDPWNLYFRFHFTEQSDTEFDNASPLGRIQPTGREEVPRNQVALAAGIAYYHRPRPASAGGGWREPPNFLNPFWRATLVSAEGSDDDKPAESLSTAGFTDHAAALRQLDAAGYRGGSRRGGRY